MSNRDSDDTEKLRNRDSESQRSRDADDTEATQDVPPLAACVKSLQEAVAHSLNAGLADNCLFILARALKAFELTTGRRLSPDELQNSFSLWWSTAKPMLPSDAYFDEWRLDFENTFAKTKVALGANPLNEAIRRADSGALPPQAARYSSPKLKRLVAVCYHLQVLQGDGLFFLGVRYAARILGTNNLYRANAMLRGLVRDGILVEAQKGTRKSATRFRFILHETP